jgi:lipopolysaccharide/colanic/teichoic acid biosynthesis glycosyltransferase
MVRMDLRYLRENSLVFDLKILLKTVSVVVFCEGAQ